MSPFVPKVWQDGRTGATPLNASGMIDLETRVTNYTDSRLVVINAGTITTKPTVDMTNRREVLWIGTLGVPAGTNGVDWSNFTAGCSLTVVMKQDATGGRSYVLPSAKWEGATPPTSSTTPDAIDIRTFFYDGTYTYGFEVGTGMA